MSFWGILRTTTWLTIVVGGASFAMVMLLSQLPLGLTLSIVAAFSVFVLVISTVAWVLTR